MECGIWVSGAAQREYRIATGAASQSSGVLQPGVANHFYFYPPSTIGNSLHYRFVGEGVFELRIDYGPGYRVYFVQIGLTIILLICGGDNSTQEQDIRKANSYWADYEKRENADQR